MENQNMLSKTIGLHRTAIANTLAIFSTMQQHGEDILKTTLEQSPWLPESSKNGYLYYADFYAKYLENLKSVTDLSFTEMERISSLGSKPEGKKPLQTTTTERTPSPPPVKKNPAVREKKVSAKKTVVAKTIPDKKPVTQNAPADKPVTQKTPTEKPVAQNAPADKPVAQNAPADKPVVQNTPTEKLVTQNVPADKPVIHEKPGVKKSTEVQASTSIPKPSVTSQTPAEPALGNKESDSQLLKPKG
jgi:hypothetical protein